MVWVIRVDQEFVGFADFEEAKRFRTMIEDDFGDLVYETDGPTLLWDRSSFIDRMEHTQELWSQ